MASLKLFERTENEWRLLALNETSPGFTIYVYAMLACQHLYLRTNAAERGLILERSRGEINARADADWHLERVAVRFEVKLRSGSNNAAVTEQIAARMAQCPVSKNLPAGLNIDVTLNLIGP